MKSQKFTVNILGSCVLRDTFEFFLELKHMAEIKNFIQNNPPHSLGYDKLSDIIDAGINEQDFSATAPVWYRWFTMNAEEKVYDRLGKDPSDFLLTSTVECFYNIYKFRKGNYISVLANSYGITKNRILEKINFPFEKITYSDIAFPELEKLIARHCEKLKRLYPESNIIFVDHGISNSYFQDGKIYHFMDESSWNDITTFLASVAKLFITFLPNSQVIKLNYEVEADPKHKWGKGPQHFKIDTYLTLGESILDICSN